MLDRLPAKGIEAHFTDNIVRVGLNYQFHWIDCPINHVVP
jgi:hypothetical protein